MFTKSALVVALGVLPVFAVGVIADTPAPAVEQDVDVIGGKVITIDSEQSTFTLEIAPLEHINVDWNDDTEFTLDGETSTADQVLVADQMVTVEHTDGLASAVRGVTEELPE